MALAVVVAAVVLASGGERTRERPRPAESPAPTTPASAAAASRPRVPASSSPYAGWLVAIASGQLVAIDPASRRRTTLALCTAPCTSIAEPAVSPDGRWLAWVVHLDAAATDGGAATDDIAVIDLAAPGTPRLLAACASPPGCRIASIVNGRPERLLWSRDGVRLAYSDGRRVFTIRPDGSDPFLLAPSWQAAIALQHDDFGPRDAPRPDDVLQPVSAPTGTAAAFVSFRDVRDEPGSASPFVGDPYVAQLWVRDEPDAEARLLAERPGCCVGGWLSGPIWSPDGGRIAWAGPRAGLGGMDVTDILVIDVATGARRELAPIDAWAPLWIPFGQSLSGGGQAATATPSWRGSTSAP